MGQTCMRLVFGLTALGLVELGAQANGPVNEITSLADQAVQQDYPSMCLGADGKPWVAYVAFDGDADSLKVARYRDGALKEVGRVAGPGIIHHPDIASDGNGEQWVFWSEHVRGQSGWKLYAKSVSGAQLDRQQVAVADSPGNHVFADAATAPDGRVWVTWQAFKGELSDVYARYHDPETGDWSEVIRVTSHDKGGNWQPRLAFGQSNAAWIAFDQANQRNFDVKVAKVTPEGSVRIETVSSTPAYEAATSITSGPQGNTFYVSWERGHKRWGGDLRNGRRIALNADKHLETARIDADTMAVTKLPCAKPVVAKAADIGKSVNQLAVNLPQVAVDGRGTLWMACRYAVSKGGWSKNRYWQIALMQYDAERDHWSKAITLPKSSLSQNRVCELARDENGNIWLCWPSDRRTTSKPGMAGIYLGHLDASSSVEYPEDPPAFPDPQLPPRNDPAKDTPKRSRGDRYEITFKGETLNLYWGDFHRHTDLSPDGTLWDGSVIEQFRYAYEAGKLDYLGTSDHTDIGPGRYTVYEWWQTKKLADVFQNPGFFVGFYAYEREQSWPWGHRNVVFAERGGPVVYIQRNRYQDSRWSKQWPVGEGENEIRPQELWSVLRQTDIPVTVISHTPGDRGMGTNWELYDKIDHAVENIMEIYQGKRVSYEGFDAPQPRVALDPQEQGARFRARQTKGMYQKALREGLRLGIFASSDHFSTGVSFGGVFASSFDRKSLVESLNARRTLGATDKIFLHYLCNGRLFGSEIKSDEKPEIELHVEGTAPLQRVTILRNEMPYKVFRPDDDSKSFDARYTDERPNEGVNRYYVRVTQKDGNMAWASPVWFNYSEND